MFNNNANLLNLHYACIQDEFFNMWLVQIHTQQRLMFKKKTVRFESIKKNYIHNVIIVQNVNR